MMQNNQPQLIENIKNIILIVGFALLVNGLLIANPGYYSHDELQKLDHITRYGFGNYFNSYVTISQGDAFDTPVRPFSFLVQGVQAFAMENYPVLVHLLDAFTHAAVASLLYMLALQYGAEKSLGLKIAGVFAISPLATIATGWPAALMDRWYVLFGLLALVCADRYVRNNQSSRLIFWILIWSSMAMLSKETAIILPGMMVLIWWFEPASIKSKRFWLAMATWMAPIVMFLLYRLPALIASFGNPQVTAYKASVVNVPDGILIYVAYPFLFKLTEAGNWVFVEYFWIWCAFGLHLLLVIGIARLYGYKVSLMYCALYLLFVAPVLLIPMKAAHYLYGSSLVYSAAIATLLHQKWALRPWCWLLGIAGFLIMVLHTIYLQNYVYSLGVCMNRAMTSTEALYLSKGRPQCVDFQAEPSAAEHVLHRINTGREQIGRWFPVRLTVSQWGRNPPENCLSLRMNNQCLVYTPN